MNDPFIVDLCFNIHPAEVSQIKSFGRQKSEFIKFSKLRDIGTQKRETLFDYKQFILKIQ